ncbi:caspase domain-containing protein [Russula compacta]|nr:caspase domain-containing protein [Russula compacta]
MSGHDSRSNTPGHLPTYRNVPGRGPQRGVYLWDIRTRGEAIPQRHGVGHGNIIDPQARASPWPQQGAGHGMPPQQHPVEHPVFFPQPNVPASHRPYFSGGGFVCHQDPGPVNAPWGTQFQGAADVQNAAGGLTCKCTSIVLFCCGSHQYPPITMPVPEPFSLCTGKRRALLIGINYSFHPNPRFRLRGCIEDAHGMANYLHENLGFSGDEVRIMTDNSPCPWNYPTKENIVAAMRALVHNARPHDSLFFYFSGHSRTIKDLDGDEQTGFDECICAADYLGDEEDPNPDTPGLIVDDLMHELMVQPLPLRCRLTAMFDSCHSGTLLGSSFSITHGSLTYHIPDLPYLYNWDGVVKEIRHSDKLGLLRQKASYADVVSISASKDHQQAIETGRGGALRLAFIDCMNMSRNNVSYKLLIQELRGYMMRNEFPQRPLLSSSHEIDTNLRFIV